MPERKKKTSLQRRFFLFTLTVSLLILFVTLGCTYYNAVQSVAASTSRYLSTYIQYADQSFASQISSVKLLAHTIASDRQIVQAAITTTASEGSYPWFQDQLRMRSYLDGLIVDKGYVEHLAVIMRNGSIYQSSNDIQLYRRDVDKQSLEDALNSTVLTLRYHPDGYFLLSRPIMVKGEILGTVYMILDAEQLFAEYALQPLAMTNLYILDEQLQLIHAGGPDAERFSPGLMATWETGVHFVGGEGFFVLRYPSSALSLTIISVMTLQDLLGDALTLGHQLLLLCVGLALLVAGVSWLFSRSLFRNLNTLMECMRAVRKGDLGRKAIVSTRDEISEAADAFNLMMDKLQMLMEDIRTQEAAKRAAEQRVLEAQIQPHFVYNSISAMQYAAQMRGQTDIEQAAAALGELMRSVLGNHDEWITLWEEKLYIDQYVVLQRFKFQNDFTLRWEVEEPLWAMRIPKLLLQPLVENALIHGIHMQEGGEIIVSARRSGKGVLLRVTDNGKGMDALQVAGIMKAPPAGLRRIGISNVRERIALCYQGQAHFDIVSIPGNFTSVEIELPPEKGDDAHGSTGSAGG
ncbi:MAG: sensor histidine kinase [Aristaeellaceae bacterium]